TCALPISGADVLLLQSGATILVDPVEADRGGRVARRVQLHRDGDQAEGDGRGSDRSCAHRVAMIVRETRSGQGLCGYVTNELHASCHLTAPGCSAPF